MEATAHLHGADARPVEVISYYDFPRRLVASGICELPFGKGRRVAGSMPALVNAVRGAWHMSAIYTYQAGSLINLGKLAFIGNINDVKKANPTRERWFNSTGVFCGSVARQFTIRSTLLRIPSGRWQQ